MLIETWEINKKKYELWKSRNGAGQTRFNLFRNMRGITAIDGVCIFETEACARDYIRLLRNTNF